MTNKKCKKEFTPRTDIIFKNIFGKECNESVLEDFLEGILEEKVKIIKLQKSSELDVKKFMKKLAY